ncbi:hypothetical protein BKA66DRAFT_493590 [Pyrenochaeta sp. MPI-SDFR-AT-0127]|nr:hypothetical protein BKA66DRAFT_493590 [Pyrenochaeta sp. MPI-SDFR-AT-0127]
MAHHFHPEDEEAGDNQSTIGRVSLAGIIKFQSNRQNITDHWNSLHASNLQEYQDELFGKLSDSIRLHEQTGEFHGQVVFIAHPHGDISAHQWSSTIYQWVNIGRYAHSRGRVEGSLASDRLKEHGVSHSPLRFFKLAAENREKLMVGYCRPKEAPFVVQQPPPAEDGWMEPLPMDSNLKGESFPVCPFEGDFLRLVSREETKPITPAALHPTIKKEYLEDPFERILIPEYTHHQPTARSLFPPPGLTVANPHRVISNIDTATLRHVSMQAPAPCSEDLGPEATIVNVNTTALDFSDPDGQGQTQEPEIANGLGQQPPTPQNFKGPFFEDSKPTSSDPTVSLSIRIDAEEKLSNWFRDGYRPARQLEYAKTLISAVAPTNPTQTFGVIGESFYVHKDNHYENTPPFVRLYEGLSEYIEEHRNGSGQSYFTRAWKAAPLQLRDVGMDGNNSYFNSATLAISSSMVRTAAEPPWSTINPLTF